MDPRVTLLEKLADPLRLRMVDRLGQGGPATVSRLAAALEVTLPHAVAASSGSTPRGADGLRHALAMHPTAG